MDPEALKLIGGGTTIGALIALIYVVGMRMVAAIDRLGVKVDTHTAVDIEHHAEVKTEIVGLRERVDGILDATPVRGIPVGLHRKPTNGGG